MSSVAASTYRPDLQGLRALAVALVLVAHLDLGVLAGGFIGVDVFFVLSGYLITRLLVCEYQQEGRIRFARFWMRRLRRLFPALLCMLGVTYVLARLLLDPEAGLLRTASLGYAATWTSNLYFAFADFDYFSMTADKDLYLHTWSLGIEEQFYLIWPFVLVAGLGLAGRLRGDLGRAVLVAGILALAAVAGLLSILPWADEQPLLAFYMMPARMSQFAAGAFVFLVSAPLGQPAGMRPVLENRAFVSGALVIVGLVLIVGSAVVISPHVRYPNASAVFPTLGAALCILGGVALQPSRFIRVLANRPMTWVGDRSYSIYLWHWPVIQIAAEYRLLERPIAMAATVTVAVGLAAFSYRWIERPFWKGSLRVMPAPRFLSAFAVAAIACLSASVVAERAGDEGRDPLAGATGQPRSDLPPIYLQGNDCDTWTRSTDVSPCTVAGEGAAQSVMLIGDSIGAQWVSALPGVFTPDDWHSVLLTKSACPIVDEDYYYAAVGGTYSVCAQWRDKAIDYIVARRPSVVIIGSSAHYDFSADQWRNGLDRIVARLRGSADSIVLLAATPAVTVADSRCSLAAAPLARWSGMEISGCEQLIADPRSDEVATHLAAVADRYPDVYALDLNGLVCPNRQCVAMTASGIRIFRDKRHLANRFVEYLVPEIREQMGELGLPGLDGPYSAATGGG